MSFEAFLLLVAMATVVAFLLGVAWILFLDLRRSAYWRGRQRLRNQCPPARSPTPMYDPKLYRRNKV